MDKLLKLTDIMVGPRFREDYGDLPALADSIRTTKGLKFNFLVVEQIDQEFHLRAGGRRFKAYELLHAGNPEVWGEELPTQEQMDVYEFVPVTLLTDLTPSDRLLIEFIENRGRKEFTWQESSNLVREFHTQRQLQYGAASTGRGKTGWSVRDTALELGLNPSDVVQYLQLADGLVESPSLGDVKQKNKALLKMKRQKQVLIADLLELDGYSVDSIQVVCADSKDYLKTLKDESIDLVITDPPWGIDFEEVTSNARTDAYESYDTNVDLMEVLEILTLCYEKLKSNSAIYMFYSAFPEKIIEGFNLLTTAGFSIEKIPLIWYKKHILSHMSQETRHMLNYEPILYGWKGERPYLKKLSRNVFEHQVPYANRIHAAEKSEALLSELIQLHTEQGDMILDPFGGSCRVADACRASLRCCLVVERNETLVKMAGLRLRGV
jgi:site-specific DNA-methyltransferase (adenine-specific)